MNARKAKGHRPAGSNEEQPLADNRLEPNPATFPPELTIGIVAAVGTPITQGVSLLQEVLSEFNYETEVLRLSSYTDRFTFDPTIPTVTNGEPARISAMMSRGSEARRITGCDDILALMAISDMHRMRPANVRVGVAFILRQLKHPDEVHLLRRTYGDGFFLLGIYTPTSEREQHLKQIGAAAETQVLIERDDHEGTQFGQRFRDTFHLADAFVQLGVDESSCRSELRRIFALIFGTRIITPTRDEAGMFLAYGAALRSAQLSRQVGAALLSAAGDLIAVGTNEVPRAGGGTYWEGQSDDCRDHVQGFDSSDTMKRELAAEVVCELSETGALAAECVQDDLVDTVLQGTRLGSLIEFGRAIHAEADALAAASRQGTSTLGATLYCTTFPCHLCAKQIVASGVSAVIYIEPYPKSRAVDLHSDSIALEQSDGTRKVLFKPLVGVAPAKYAQLFSALDPSGKPIRRKGETGRLAGTSPIPRLHVPYWDVLARERVQAERLSALMGEHE